MTLVAGVDSSTQSCKVVIREAETGALVRQGRAAHPAGTEIHPSHWWTALLRAVEEAGGLADVAAISVAGQQHGMVCLDEAGEVVRDALLWNDTRSARAAADLVAELGGPGAWADAVGSVPVAAFTVAKLRWLAEHEPDNARRTAAVCLPHDWLTWRLAGALALGGGSGRGGGSGPGNGSGRGGGSGPRGGSGSGFDLAAWHHAPPPPLDLLTTDRGDASGTGYWSPATGAYRTDLLKAAFGAVPLLPRVLGPADRAGDPASAGPLLAPGTGDNMAAALGVGAGPGDVVVSLGTSGTVFAVAETPSADPTGAVAGFADATGRFLPLVCTLNAARVLDAAAGLAGVGLDELSDLALRAPAGAGGLTLVPYLEGERTPNRPTATGSVLGLTLATSTPAHLARAAVEGMLCGLADALDALGTRAERVLLIGGAARSEAVRRVAPTVFGVPIAVPSPGEYVADGAARQAAALLTPPDWRTEDTETYDAPAVPEIRARYARATSHVLD
ncbi:xylulokinase [Nonomuraea sp. NPDC049655]|uniref:xylulokinase n=1 Tax=Nonomuraea sp. NPDC049655 TaxID=3364355 RepID=UPI0037AC9093